MNLIAEATKIQGSNFIAEVEKTAQRLGFHASWLLAIMYYESRFLHNVTNPQSGATGLIQFMPSTAQALGTSTQALARMTAIEQIKFVEKFYLPIKGKAKAFADVYLYTFASAYTNPQNAPDNAILATGQSAFYHCKTENVCTVADFKRYVTQKYNNDFPNTDNKIIYQNPQNNTMIQNQNQLFLTVIIGAILVYFVFFYK